MRLSMLTTFGIMATLSSACSSAFNKGGADINNNDTGTIQDTDTNDTDTNDTDTSDTQDTGPSDSDVDDDNDGYTENQGDCDDNNNTLNPGESDSTVDGIDQNCDDFDGPDADNDGYADMVAGGDDCDDNNASVNPGQVEDPNDGLDTDCDGVADARFQIDYVDEVCIDCAGPSAVTVDSAGQVHVVYEDAGDLWYRYLQAFGVWSNYDTLDTDSSRTPAYVTDDWYGLDAKVDAQDNVQVAYVSDGAADTALYFMFRDSAGTWSEELLVDGFDPLTNSGPSEVGWHVSMDIDSNNFPAFSYYNADEQVPYIYDLTDSLVTNVLDLSGAYFSLDFCQSVIVLGYDTTCDGFYSGVYSGIALDSNDNAHVSFHNHNDSILGATENQYARIPDISESNAIGLYQDPSALLNGDLCHWITNSVGSIDNDSGGIYNSTAIKSDGSGDVCVAYHHEVQGELRYACSSQASSCDSWVTETVDNTGNVGHFASLAFNSNDQPYIAYYDETGSSLKVATKEGGLWEIIEIDSEGDVGRFADLDIDNNDIVHITYLEDAGTKGKLKYAWGR